MRPKRPFLSVVVPLYNEEKRVKNINRVINYLSSRKFSWELFLVNDGSLDHTQSLLSQFRQPRVSLISYPKNHGKGYAVKRGMLAASGDYRIFLDVDLSTPLTEFKKIMPLLGKYDCLIGTRKIQGARVTIHQPWLRENLGKGFTFLSRWLLGLPISDFTCGFKCFTARCARDVFVRAKVYRWGFDSEVLFLCHRLGYTIKEVPVSWKNDSQTKVKFPHDIISSLLELITIRFNAVRKYY